MVTLLVMSRSPVCPPVSPEPGIVRLYVPAGTTIVLGPRVAFDWMIASRSETSPGTLLASFSSVVVFTVKVESSVRCSSTSSQTVRGRCRGGSRRDRGVVGSWYVVLGVYGGEDATNDWYPARSRRNRSKDDPKSSALSRFVRQADRYSWNLFVTVRTRPDPRFRTEPARWRRRSDPRVGGPGHAGPETGARREIRPRRRARPPTRSWPGPPISGIRPLAPARPPAGRTRAPGLRRGPHRGGRDEVDGNPLPPDPIRRVPRPLRAPRRPARA